MIETQKGSQSARQEKLVLHKIKSLHLTQYLSAGKYLKNLTRKTEEHHKQLQNTYLGCTKLIISIILNAVEREYIWINTYKCNFQRKSSIILEMTNPQRRRS